MTNPKLNVDLMERLNHLYLNLEQFSCSEVRFILSEAIDDLRVAEHMSIRGQIELSVGSNHGES